MAISKPAVRSAWGDGAAGTSITDPGETFVKAGWPLSTTPPSRQYFNWVLNYCMNGVRYFSRRGVGDWDVAETYQNGDVVIGSDQTLYQSSGGPNIGNNPVTGGGWTTLRGYALASSLAVYVTQTSLTAQLVGDGSTTGYATNTRVTALANTLALYVTQSSLSSQLLGDGNLTGYAPNSRVTNIYNTLNTSLNNLATATQDASYLIRGTLAAARLPNVGTMPNVTVQADPGTVPSGPVGAIFFYY